jgi:hypothetical protein
VTGFRVSIFINNLNAEDHSIMTPSVRAQVITRRSYNRPLDDTESRFESWSQTVDRSVGHQRWLWERAQGGPLTHFQVAELEELRSLMLGRRSLLAGRTLWLGGTEVVRRREASNFNCSMIEVRTVHDLVDIFWLLLQGCGTGFRPISGALSGFTRRMEVEVVRSTRSGRGGREANRESYDPETRTWTIAVGDSAEAWAKSVGKLVAGKFPARKLVLDFSEIRPGGVRLKGYGWMCNGDRALSVAYAAICAILNRQAGKLLSKLDIWDLVNWLGTVLSNRRSAQIGLIDQSDPEARSVATMKPPGYWEGNPQRSQSNNSVVFHDRPSARQIRDAFDLMVASGGGEPGFVNAEAARRRAPWFKGTNPCVTDDTWIHTDDGPRQVRDLVGEPFRALVDGFPHSSTPRGFYCTGQKMVYEVRTDRGYSFRCTENHEIQEVYSLTQKARRTRWTPLSDLRVGDRISLHDHGSAVWTGEGSFNEGWLLGSLLGDGVFATSGSSRTAMLSYWGPTKIVMRDFASSMLRESLGGRSDCGSGGVATVSASAKDRLNLHNVRLRALAERLGVRVTKTLGPEIEQTSSDFHRGFLSGWFDADGAVLGSQAKGVSVRLTSVALDNLRVAQRMLARLGIISTLYRDRTPAGLRLMPDGRGGSREYECQALHELVISGSNLGRFAERVGFVDPSKTTKLRGLLGGYRRVPNRERFTARIVEIEPIGMRPVYDCTIPTASRFDGNGVNLHNCGEILLPSNGFCNLCETDVAKFRGDHLGLHRALWIIARANYRQTVVELRDGVLQDSWHQQNEFLRLCGVGLTGIVRRPDLTPYDYRQLRNTAVAGAYSMADELGLERPKNVTTVKPSGTLSKCMDTTEGCHKPLGRYLLNNVQFGRHDPGVPRLLDAGYRVLDHPTDPDGVLVTLPVAWDEVSFDVASGVPVNLEPAVAQLERYRMLMDAWCDQNVSITVSYDPAEVPAMVKWFDRHWDEYVGVSFLFRNDPTRTAADLGFAYLPQEVVTRGAYEAYASSLRPVYLDDLDGPTSEVDEECATGACPVR